MPHAELRYSADLTFSMDRLSEAIEMTVLTHDPGAGETKCRAYPATQFHHTHMLVDVAMLPKPHRDKAFLEALRDDLERAIKAQLAQPCAFSLALRLNDEIYITNMHIPGGTMV